VSRIDDISKRRRKADTEEKTVRPDELNARLADTAKVFADAAVQARPEDEPEPSRDDIQDDVYRAIRALVADELTVVSRLEGPDGIAPEEKERQIVRRALSKLTKTELQSAATSVGLRKSGTKEELLDRLVYHLDGDLGRASSLLNSVDRHAREGRRHVARLFTFEDLAGVDVLARQLEKYQRRYVRTDIASWFVVDDVDVQDLGLDLAGHLRSYDVAIDAVGVRASEREDHVTLALRRDESVLRAHSPREAETVAAVEAFAFLIGEMPLPALAKAAREQPRWGSAGGLRLRTSWLLGFLLGLLDHPAMTLMDVTSASFERSTGDRVEPVGADVPHIGSAHLRGQHVLDSQSACRHLASSERLRAVTALVKFTRGEDTPVTLPVRIVVENSYVAVMTGFGGAGADATRSQHLTLEDYAVSQVRNPEVDADRLEEVVEEMFARAVAADPPEAATLFARRQDAKIRLDRG
jgi:hypothetical protein